MNKPLPPADFDENPVWTPEMHARARPASEVHGQTLARQMVRKRGRPAGSSNATRKEQIALRVDADVVTSFKESGAGWQTRMNQSLRTRVDVTYSKAVGGWLVTINRPIDGIAGRSHEILGRFDELEAAKDRADKAAEREPGNAKVIVWDRAA